MKTSLQSQNFNSIGLWSPNRYEIDLSNEALNIDFDQGAAKISEVTWPASGASVWNLAASAISYPPPTLTSDIFAAS